LSRRSGIRRGEKVPAAVGTVAHGLVEGELTAFDGQGAGFGADRAKAATVGAGLLRGEGLGLLLREGGEGTLGQATSGSGGNLLQGHKVDVSARAGLAEGATSDDFSPADGQVMDLLEFFSRELALRHGHSCPVLARINGEVFLLSF
jgi:hypothetical protein